MFKRIDQDNSGMIDYHEFLTATVDYDKLNNKENLKEAFNLFDQNRDGNITCEEIQTLLQSGNFKFDEEAAKQIVSELDENKDNQVIILIRLSFQISFEEFLHVMDKTMDK